MSQVEVELESKVNEIYAKTTITQKYTNPEDNPLEQKYLYIKIQNYFSKLSKQK